jgi:serine/threonine protein kinase
VQQAGWLDGRPYVVCEHVAHGSLSKLSPDGELPLNAAIELAAKLADLVGYLHRQGVVHGNLKPSNVLLSADGIPRVTDLRLTGGLFVKEGATTEAAAETAAALEAVPPTTLAYLAPEFLADPTAAPRPNADIYGLGLILYELLAGRPAFLAETARETLDLVRAGWPTAPSKINSRVPPRLDAIVRRCLDPDPWRRYARAFAVGKALRY